MGAHCALLFLLAFKPMFFNSHYLLPCALYGYNIVNALFHRCNILGLHQTGSEASVPRLFRVRNRRCCGLRRSCRSPPQALQLQPPHRPAASRFGTAHASGTAAAPAAATAVTTTAVATTTAATTQRATAGRR